MCKVCTCYFIPVSQINKKLNELSSTFDNAFLFSIGKTSEGRDMMAINVSTINDYYIKVSGIASSNKFIKTIRYPHM